MVGEIFKILLVSSGAATGRLVSAALSEVTDIQLDASAVTPGIAVARLERRDIDMVLFDLEGADRGALRVLRQIRRQYSDIGVVVMSQESAAESDATLEALGDGALDYVAKPCGIESSLRSFRGELRLVASIFRNRRNFEKLLVPNGGDGQKSFSKNRHGGGGRRNDPAKGDARIVGPTAEANRCVESHVIDAVGIGVSAGGPGALLRVVPNLPENLAVPVFVVQHMPPPFTSTLASSLSKRSRLKVAEAVSGMSPVLGTVYIAPGGKHMRLLRRKSFPSSRKRIEIVLSEEASENGCRPSVDYLFRSMAQVYGSRTLVVVMTGMGADGLEGVVAIKNAGGVCVTQEESSCVVYGMPRAIDEAGLSDRTASPEKIASLIAAAARNGRQ